MSAITRQMDDAWNADPASYRRLDTAFRQRLLDHCGNECLLKACQLISGRMAVLRTRLSSSRDHVRRSYDEHLEIAKLVRDGAVEHAVSILEGHIGRRQGSYWIANAALTS